MSPGARHLQLAIPLFVTAVLLCGGCGYQHNASMDNANGYDWQTLYRGDVKTVAVPIFGNRTYWRGVEFQLTKAVINELESQTPYKVVARDEADTLLEGEVEGVSVQTISNSPITSEPQEQNYVVGVNFTWTDLRNGKILVHREHFQQSAPFYPTLGEGRFVGDQLNIERLAVAIVQQMQADWGNATQPAPQPAPQ
jgi:hypothetical protein